GSGRRNAQGSAWPDTHVFSCFLTSRMDQHISVQTDKCIAAGSLLTITRTGRARNFEMDDRRFQVRKFGNFKLDRVQSKFSEFPNLNLTIVRFELLWCLRRYLDSANTAFRKISSPSSN